MKDQRYTDIIIESLKEWPDKDKKIVREGLFLLDLHREIEMVTDIIGSKLGLHVRQIEILEILYNHHEIELTPAQLADEVHLTRSTMTGNLDSLQKKGFIKRESHPNDRRMLLITLTQEGIDFCKKTMPMRYAHVLRVMKGMSGDERKNLRGIYEKLLGIIREISEE
ncbi:MAG: MarR family transcriptional regulator [Deltaproteobacteria bacterium]|nr:MarR family transcriptional regulator [Deltaproteobacteria bacterium]